MPPHLLQEMWISHNNISCRLMRRKNKCKPDVSWVYTNVGEDLEEAGLWPVEEYITQWKNMMAQYIATRLIYRIHVDKE